jgi:hypothetical protein
MINGRKRAGIVFAHHDILPLRDGKRRRLVVYKNPLVRRELDGDGECQCTVPEAVADEEEKKIDPIVDAPEAPEIGAQAHPAHFSGLVSNHIEPCGFEGQRHQH